MFVIMLLKTKILGLDNLRKSKIKIYENNNNVNLFVYKCFGI